MRRTSHIMLAALLGGCVSTPAPAPQAEYSQQRVNPMPISSEMMQIITIGIRNRLKDPASASFGTMLAGKRILNGREEIVVCGYVNAKNSFGGYGGDQPFVAKIFPQSNNAFQLVAMGDESPNAALLVGGSCSAAGLPILTYDPRVPI